MDSVAPSGEQHDIRYDDQRAVVVEVGGALRTYEVGGAPRLDGYDVDDMCTGARGQTLVPWPNRIKDGEYSWDGTDYTLALTEPDKHTAIHGLVRWTPFVVVDRGEDRIGLEQLLPAQTGYPFVLRVRIDYRLDAGGLTVRTTATNVGAGPAPYASGAHPYLTVGTPTIDGCRLRVPANRWLPTDDKQQIPTGVESVDGTPYDFREPREIGDTQIDYAYTDLLRDPDGRARVRLEGPDGAVVALWVDDHYPYLEVFTGDTLPTPDKRRTGVGCEPMTAPPNAFASGTDVVRLEPGETFSSEWGVEPGR